MVNKMCSIYRKKSGKGSNDHMTVGNEEMENITVGNEKGGGGGGGGGGGVRAGEG